MDSKTGNGAAEFSHTGQHLLEFFSKGGSIRGQKTYYTEKKEDIVGLFKSAWYTGDYTNCMKLLFWCRDCRNGGAGNRQTTRDILKWLADQAPEWVNANIHLIPLYGRWDDLKSLYGTECEEAALDLWSSVLNAEDPNVTPLAAKWAGRQDKVLRKYMGLSPRDYRKLVVKQTGYVVEHSMCSGKWEDIDFSKVPSVATARYRNAFKKRQEARYEKWCLSLADSKKVNASVLFPHDLIRTIHSTGDKNDAFRTLMNVTFEKLPDYIEDPSIKIMPICDFSGSMNTLVSGSVIAMDVSLALGLYCSDRLGKDNPFYRKLIPFSSDSKLESWKDMDVVDAVRKIPNGYCGSTNIVGALDKLLEAAKFWNIPKDQMVTTLLILSDMQWDQGGVTGDYWSRRSGVAEANVHESIATCMDKWEEAGYDRPKIVYWNLHAYTGSPETAFNKSAALISGFSPAILKSTLSGKNVTPMDVMIDAISKYEIVVPE